ncbi:MAG: thioesterase family protein, partial [Acidimicrobiales bacterium]|nr:thioesterase family protein [Acidimicrobiales bacterium]
MASENGPSASLQPNSSVSDLLNLRPGNRRNSWLLHVTKELGGASGTLHGGCALAAVAAAMEATSDRPVSFISGQFLSRAPLDSTVTIDVDQLVVGNRITQAAATCTYEDVVVLRASAGLGGRELGVDRSWLSAPKVPPPEECPPRGP